MFVFNNDEYKLLAMVKINLCIFIFCEAILGQWQSSCQWCLGLGLPCVATQVTA